MRTSQHGLDFIAHEEGKAKWDATRGLWLPYKDPEGYPTIYVGHLIKSGEDFSAGITDERGMQILGADVLHVDLAIEANVKVPLTQNQWDAIASWAFNEGVGALRPEKCTFIRLLNAGHYDEVPAQLPIWDVTAGHHAPYLHARRLREAALWNTPDDAPKPVRPELTDAERGSVLGIISRTIMAEDYGAREIDDPDSSDTIPSGPPDPIDEPTNPATPVARAKSTPPSA